jgi:hypothetical protein
MIEKERKDRIIRNFESGDFNIGPEYLLHCDNGITCEECYFGGDLGCTVTTIAVDIAKEVYPEKFI